MLCINRKCDIFTKRVVMINPYSILKHICVKTLIFHKAVEYIFTIKQISYSKNIFIVRYKPEIIIAPISYFVVFIICFDNFHLGYS